MRRQRWHEDQGFVLLNTAAEMSAMFVSLSSSIPLEIPEYGLTLVFREWSFVM
jgi:hypothetical protein